MSATSSFFERIMTAVSTAAAGSVSSVEHIALLSLLQSGEASVVVAALLKLGEMLSTPPRALRVSPS